MYLYWNGSDDNINIFYLKSHTIIYRQGLCIVKYNFCIKFVQIRIHFICVYLEVHKKFLRTSLNLNKQTCKFTIVNNIALNN